MLKARLSGAAYNADKASALTCELADDIKQRIKGAEWSNRSVRQLTRADERVTTA